jgi:ClpX C4-type zinc finger/Pyridoxamine 5'-phosphate oxidase
MAKDRQIEGNGPRCSFCDKANDRVRRMVGGPRGVYICNECVDLCNDIFSELEPQQPETFRWADLADQQPGLAAVAKEKLLGPGVVLVGTTRRDGSARISAVEPLVMDGELWLSMMKTSTKALDLRRDQRVSINSTVTGPEPGVEVKVRGTARVVHDREVHERYAARVSAELGWQPVVGQFTLFAIDIFDVAQVGYDPETHGQHVARWPAGDEYVRPAISPTSLGPRQRVRRLLQ